MQNSKICLKIRNKERPQKCQTDKNSHKDKRPKCPMDKDKMDKPQKCQTDKDKMDKPQKCQTDKNSHKDKRPKCQTDKDKTVKSQMDKNKTITGVTSAEAVSEAAIQWETPRRMPTLI
jgi:hypothetical protein